MECKNNDVKAHGCRTSSDITGGLLARGIYIREVDAHTNFTLYIATCTDRSTSTDHMPTQLTLYIYSSFTSCYK